MIPTLFKYHSNEIKDKLIPKYYPEKLETLKKFRNSIQSQIKANILQEME